MKGRWHRSAAMLIALAGVFAGWTALPSGAAAQAPLQATFSHGVVVDEQRPGYEPDLAVSPVGSHPIYSSVPFGFSTTDSFVWSSIDQGNSYKLVPGNIPPAGKPFTCAGGGDTDLVTDAGGSLYFSDLQGLTNVSVSRSDDGGANWSTNCASYLNTPVDRMWFASRGSHAAGNLQLYQDTDAVAQSGTNLGANALVEAFSTDGVTFVPVTNPNVVSDCGPTTAPLDCVTGDEGISGNQVVDPGTGIVYIVHTNHDQSGVQVEKGVVTPGTPPSAVWTHMTVYDGGHYAGGAQKQNTGFLIPSIARDRGGNLYAVWGQAPQCDTNIAACSSATSTNTAPSQIYMSVLRAGSPTWSGEIQVSPGGTNLMPWVAAGDAGRVDIAYYHTDTINNGAKPPTYGPDFLSSAEWNVYMTQSIDVTQALLAGAAPALTTNKVTEYPNKRGGVCTNGVGCTGDRSLGDYLEVQAAPDGRALISYVDDTSSITAGSELAGPEMVATQVGGSSLYVSPGTISGAGAGPGTPVGSVTDPAGDAATTALGQVTTAPAIQDILASSISQPDSSHLLVKMTVKGDLTAGTAVDPAGLMSGLWATRWTSYAPNATSGINGHVYYAAMEAVAGGSPTFFDGEVVCGVATSHCKFMGFPSTKTAPGAVTKNPDGTSTISVTLPLADVGSPSVGAHLYSVTGFTATEPTPAATMPIFQLADSTTPYRYDVLAANASLPASPSPGTAAGNAGNSPLPNTARGSGATAALILLLALVLLGLAGIGLARRLDRRGPGS